MKIDVRARLEPPRASRSGVGHVAAAATAVAICATFAPAPALAQYLGGGEKTAAEVQQADLLQLADKVARLSRAMPDSAFDWRPMEGVRSFREVVVLVTAEAELFPTMWGFDKSGSEVHADIGAETTRLRALARDDLVVALERSVERLRTVLEGITQEERARRVGFFGLTVELHTAFDLVLDDMHEHLGQAIAYARVHGVVPPWSQPG